MASEALKSHYPAEYSCSIAGGLKPDFRRCCAKVRSTSGWGLSQCARKNGHGPDGAYCKQHDPAAVEKRKKATAEKHEKQWNQRLFELRGKSFAKALKRIADGDNDPRTTARNALGDLYDKLD